MRPVVKKVGEEVKVENLQPNIELDPRALGENVHGVYDVHVTITSGDEQHEYEIWGYNPGNGYLRAKRVPAPADEVKD
jgi:hypothetical protein